MDAERDQVAYDAGVKAADGLAAGLRADLAELDAAMESLTLFE